MVYASLPQGSSADGATSILRRELHLAGVSERSLFPPWAKSRATREAILREFLVALDAPMHEGLIAPYGALIVPKGTAIDGTLLPLTARDLDLARKTADGSSALMVWDEGTPRGVRLLDPSVAPDLELTRMARPLQGIALRRDNAGVVRIYEPQLTLRHVGRRWTVSPTLADALTHVLSVVTMADRQVLFALLEFAYYVLSPWRIGATLVWILSDRSPDDTATDLRPFRLRVGAGDDEPPLSLAAHLLGQFDGATVVDREGKLLTTGVHLTASHHAQDVIPPRPGTRHTSARRASFDHPDTLVVTVSADGPVSVFSDGVDIFDLWFYAPTRVLDSTDRTTRRPAPRPEVREATCARCRKTVCLETDAGAVAGPAAPVSCPVCGEALEHEPGRRTKVRVKKVF